MISIIKYIIILLCATTSMARAASNGKGAEDSSQYSAESIRQYAITLDVGFFSPGSDAASGWRESIAFRAGIRKLFTEMVTVGAYLDYYDHLAILGDHLGPASLSPPSARRRDIAVYAGLSFFRVIFIGAGSYYTTSDAVVRLYSGGSSPWQDSGFSQFRLFYILGLTYDIRVTDALFLPVGLYYRNSYATNNTLGPISLKMGAGIEF